MGASAGAAITGSSNTAIGYNAMLEAQGAVNSNTAVGSGSLQNITTGQENVAVGQGAAASLTTGRTNVAIGREALYFGTTETDHNVAIGGNCMAGNFGVAAVNDCVAVGESALNAVLTAAASGSVAVGKDALGALTSGAGNTAIGYEAGKVATDNSRNTVIGYGAFIESTSSDDNVVIGYHALRNAGSAGANSEKNIAIGSYALDGADGGEANNMAIGYGAMGDLNNSSATRNIAIGNNAADGMGSGLVHVDNVFLGYDAGGGTWANNLSSSNVGIGSYVMDAAMDGALNNTGVGYGALGALTEGLSNTIVGGGSGGTISDGSYNTSLGQITLTANNADNNTAIGYGALTSANSAHNTAVGSQALWHMTSGSENTALGRRAGRYYWNGSADAALATTTNGVYIGDMTRANADSMTNEIVIGASSIGSGSYTTTIGSGNVFKFASKQYTCDHADGEDGKSAASEAAPLKLPAYSIIKSISVTVDQLSNLGTFNVALYHSTDTAAPADDTALGGTPVEVLGAGASDTCSGNSASAVDIALGSGTVVKQSYYNGFGGAGLPVGTADRYIHVGQSGTSNGTTDPSTAGLISVLVEYVGLD